MVKLLFASLGLAAVASASAGTYYYSGALTSTSPVFRNPGGSSTGVGQYYSVLPFTVGTTGAYTFETASPNTSANSVSNALDTYLLLYTGSFVPATPSANLLASNDDFSGTFSVLPGPFANVSPNSTGSSNAQPGSSVAGVTLTAGTSYFLVNSSYRDTSVVASSGAAGPTGAFYTGIGGVGAINPVPEPATIAALGLGAVAALRRRRKA